MRGVVYTDRLDFTTRRPEWSVRHLVMPGTDSVSAARLATKRPARVDRALSRSTRPCVAACPTHADRGRHGSRLSLAGAAYMSSLVSDGGGAHPAGVRHGRT